jgi:hypothetical protein
VADQLRIAAVHAFEHSFSVGCLVAVAVAVAGPRACSARTKARNER